MAESRPIEAYICSTSEEMKIIDDGAGQRAHGKGYIDDMWQSV